MAFLVGLMVWLTTNPEKPQPDPIAEASSTSRTSTFHSSAPEAVDQDQENKARTQSLHQELPSDDPYLPPNAWLPRTHRVVTPTRVYRPDSSLTQATDGSSPSKVPEPEPQPTTPPHPSPEPTPEPIQPPTSPPSPVPTTPNQPNTSPVPPTTEQQPTSTPASTSALPPSSSPDSGTQTTDSPTS